MTDFYETLEAGAGEVHRRVWRFCSHKFLFEWRFLFVAMAGYLCWFFYWFQADLKIGEEIARCPSCSLYITVIYNPVSFFFHDPWILCYVDAIRIPICVWTERCEAGLIPRVVQA